LQDSESCFFLKSAKQREEGLLWKIHNPASFLKVWSRERRDFSGRSGIQKAARKGKKAFLRKTCNSEEAQGSNSLEDLSCLVN
jgi:hypothetical protein